MSEFVHKDMTFSLFREKTKRNENSPDWSGKGMVNGIEVRVAAWEKQARGGVILSGKISPLGAPRETQQEQSFKAQSPLPRDLDDEVPF